MNPPKRSGKKIRTPRASKHIHLWPELELMPPLDHWPDRPGPYRPETSEVLRFLVEGFGMTLDEAEKVFGSARKRGSIRFNRNTGLWYGRKGGQP